jgi:hypothetical protein
MLQPTFIGLIQSTNDALLLFEAVLQGRLQICDRMTPEERKLVRHGSVFVWNSEGGGVKRWTDGLSWSKFQRAQSFAVPFSPLFRTRHLIFLTII